MESISLKKRLLVAGGILVCGYIVYCILRNQEEELKQQQETEDADFVIIDEHKNSEKFETVEKKTANSPMSSDDSSLQKTTANLSVIKNVSMEKSISKAQDKKVQLENNIDIQVSKLPEIQESDKQAQDIAVATKNTSTINDIVVNQPTKVTIPNEEKVANDDFPLQLGSKGKRVWNLKVYMLKNHGASGVVTDDYDALTVERVKRYLKADNVTEQLYRDLNMEGKRKKKRNATKKKY
ncbi:hypothetical protein U8527_06950 [Kordia algicida OT-1]|uniref:Uncharacterized protein n=1 Tax=Kordia algicida OT-1 TaxID=391587 RepID=A9E9J5_9FLAO|nr:hypothetical protein [Kordia algicida]EDP94678.1 hypothetical protein KAOT1_00340 [Kordia algicida OT-1]